MKKISIPIEIIQIETHGYHILVPAKCNGLDLLLIIDTGASQSIFDISHSAFEEIKKTEGENIKDSSGINAPISGILQGIIPSLDLGIFAINNLETLFMPFNHINNLYQTYGYSTVGGIIGGDILKRYNASIHYDISEMILRIN